MRRLWSSRRSNPPPRWRRPQNRPMEVFARPNLTLGTALFRTSAAFLLRPGRASRRTSRTGVPAIGAVGAGWGTRRTLKSIPLTTARCQPRRGRRATQNLSTAWVILPRRRSVCWRCGGPKIGPSSRGGRKYHSGVLHGAARREGCGLYKAWIRVPPPSPSQTRKRKEEGGKRRRSNYSARRSCTFIRTPSHANAQIVRYLCHCSAETSAQKLCISRMNFPHSLLPPLFFSTLLSPLFPLLFLLSPLSYIKIRTCPSHHRNLARISASTLSTKFIPPKYSSN